MRRGTTLAIALAALLVTTGAAGAADGGQSASGRYIVVLKGSGAPGQVAKTLASQLGFELTHVYKHSLSGFAAAMPASAAAALEANPAVDYVQPRWPRQHRRADAPHGINRADADLSPTAGINGVDERVNVDVAVIDTGVDLDHPDLNVFTAGARNCSTGRSADDRQRSRHPRRRHDRRGRQQRSASSESPRAPASGRSRCSTPWAPDHFASIICGIDYVTAHAGEIEVANMSLGGAGTDDRNCGLTQRRRPAPGDLPVRGGGRHLRGRRRQRVGTTRPSPRAGRVRRGHHRQRALADFNGAAGGGAASTCRADVDDTFADFSNFGADVDLIAPGVCILSTYRSGNFATRSPAPRWRRPHVAGAAALYKATHPTATPAPVKSALQSAGNLNWTWPSEDGDATQERLLNVAGF